MNPLECSNEHKKLVPLYRIVSAAIIDTHEDIGKVFQTYAHFAARGLKKIDREVFRTGLRKVLLTVNRSTNTATLPPDFNEECFVAAIVNGRKIPLRLRTDLIDLKNIEEIECIDKCPKCDQDKSICNDLTITEDTVLVIVNDSVQEQTVIKKLYPDGSYYLETKIPVWDIESETIIYTTTKQFIAALDLKPCGCIDETPKNLNTIKSCCYDVWCSHFAPCDNSCTTDLGGYMIFEETGLIQFDNIGKFTKVYIEYWGFMAKKNGQYMVPEVAFETLVNYVKFKNVENRRSIPLIERKWTLDQYVRERENMNKILGRISLSQIVQALSLTPKFDIDEYVCEPVTIASSSSVVTSSVPTPDECVATTTAICPPASGTKVFTPFGIATVVGVGGGAPVAGTNTYQDDKLKGALGVNMIIVNNTPETIAALQFTLDTVTGTLRRWQADGVTPNLWQAGPPADILIVPTFFKLI